MKIFIESIKAFTFGVIIGLIVVYFTKADALTVPIIFGIIALSIHSRNNVYLKKE